MSVTQHIALDGELGTLCGVEHEKCSCQARDSCFHAAGPSPGWGPGGRAAPCLIPRVPAPHLVRSPRTLFMPRILDLWPLHPRCPHPLSREGPASTSAYGRSSPGPHPELRNPRPHSPSPISIIQTPRSPLPIMGSGQFYRHPNPDVCIPNHALLRRTSKIHIAHMIFHLIVSISCERLCAKGTSQFSDVPMKCIDLRHNFVEWWDITWISQPHPNLGYESISQILGVSHLDLRYDLMPTQKHPIRLCGPLGGQ
jgi:hypothetical protein